jgi:uncharacterized protein YecE (DUF72 family)
MPLSGPKRPLTKDSNASVASPLPSAGPRAQAFIGTSGYFYQHWAGEVFNLAGLPQKDWPAYYFRSFDSLELNFAFYRLPTEKAFEGWRRGSPPHARFAVKGSRFITHMKKLSEPEQHLALYFSRARHLGAKLKMVLWQLPPRFRKNTERLKGFVRELARHGPVRHCFEFRDPSWLSPDVFDVLREGNMALCMADPPVMAGFYPETADYIYLRRHGSPAQPSCSPSHLAKDARDIQEWVGQGKDVYICFNNDAGGWAVRNASDLKRLLNSAGAAAPAQAGSGQT